MRKSSLSPLVSPASKLLILGTMPGEKSIKLQQYYGNRGNHFWKILFAVLEETFSNDYEARKALLLKYDIALWNTLASCEREGSRDDKIKKPLVNNFENFFETYPNIGYVFFESISAARLYAKFAYKSERIQYRTLPSTSGLNAGMSFDEKMELWKQLKEFL